MHKPAWLHVRPDHSSKDKSVLLAKFSADEQSPAILFSCPALQIQAEKAEKITHIVCVTTHTHAHTTLSLRALKTEADKLMRIY